MSSNLFKCILQVLLVLEACSYIYTVYSSLKKSLIIIKLLYNLLTSLSVNQEEKEVKRLEQSLIFKAKEVKGLYKLT